MSTTPGLPPADPPAVLGRAGPAPDKTGSAALGVSGEWENNGMDGMIVCAIHNTAPEHRKYRGVCASCVADGIFSIERLEGRSESTDPTRLDLLVQAVERRERAWGDLFQALADAGREDDARTALRLADEERLHIRTIRTSCELLAASDRGAAIRLADSAHPDNLPGVPTLAAAAGIDCSSLPSRSANQPARSGDRPVVVHRPPAGSVPTPNDLGNALGEAAMDCAVSRHPGEPGTRLDEGSLEDRLEHWIASRSVS